MFVLLGTCFLPRTNGVMRPPIGGASLCLWHMKTLTLCFYLSFLIYKKIILSRSKAAGGVLQFFRALLIHCLLWFLVPLQTLDSWCSSVLRLLVPWQSWIVHVLWTFEDFGLFIFFWMKGGVGVLLSPL